MAQRDLQQRRDARSVGHDVAEVLDSAECRIGRHERLGAGDARRGGQHRIERAEALDALDALDALEEASPRWRCSRVTGSSGASSSA